MWVKLGWYSIEQEPVEEQENVGNEEEEETQKQKHK